MVNDAFLFGRFIAHSNIIMATTAHAIILSINFNFNYYISYFKSYIFPFRKNKYFINYKLFFKKKIFNLFASRVNRM